MKTRKVNRKDHHVPLDRQVVALFRELQKFSEDGRFVFLGARAKTDTIRDVRPLTALRDLGYSGILFSLGLYVWVSACSAVVEEL